VGLLRMSHLGNAFFNSATPASVSLPSGFLSDLRIAVSTIGSAMSFSEVALGGCGFFASIVW